MLYTEHASHDLLVSAFERAEIYTGKTYSPKNDKLKIFPKFRKKCALKKCVKLSFETAFYRFKQVILDWH